MGAVRIRFSLVVFLAITLPLFVRAETHAPSSTSSHATLTQEDAALEEAVTQTMAAVRDHVHRTNRSFYAYHYAHKAGVGVDPALPTDKESPPIKNHIRDWSASFWNPNQPVTDNDVKAVYFASDPVSPRVHFGG